MEVRKVISFPQYSVTNSIGFLSGMEFEYQKYKRELASDRKALWFSWVRQSVLLVKNLFHLCNKSGKLISYALFDPLLKHTMFDESVLQRISLGGLLSNHPSGRI